MFRAPSSIQRYIDQSARTSGFGGTSGSLFFIIIYLFLSPCRLANVYRPQFYRYRVEIEQAHSPRGDTIALTIILGVRPPWGKFSPQIFFQDIDLQIFLSHVPDPGKNKQKKFLTPDP